MKKIIIAVLAVLIAAAGIITGISFISREGHVEQSQVMRERVSDWTSAHSVYVNNRGINLQIDEENRPAGPGAFLEDDFALMLERSLIRDAFECAVHLYEDRTLRIAKGDVVLQINIGEYEMMVSRTDSYDEAYKTVTISHTPYWKDGSLFIPAELLTEGIGYSYRWEADSSTAVFASDDPAIDNMASYYSYADIGNIAYVRNQGNIGACWAFAAIASLEYTLQPEETWDFSEDNMLLNNGYMLDDYGGDYLIAVSYLTSWKGPVREEDDPYNDGYSDPGLAAVKHVQEVQFLPERDFTAIKKMIFRHGVVESSLFIELNDDNTDLDPECYDPYTSSYIYTGDQQPNHEIVIIGWDDNYPAEYFGGKADSDGAFICKNSWGSAFGENGIFYVSYCDKVIGKVAVAYTGIEDADNYDNIYQHDQAGWVGLIGYGRNKAYMANVYEAASDEELEAVGFYATGSNTSYKVYVVSDYKGPQSLDISSPVCAQGTLRNAGFYTIELKDAVKLKAGKKFAVIVEITTPSSTKPVAIEITTDNVVADIYGKESYLSNYGDQWECLQDEDNGNICLKAYTKKRD